MQAFPKMLQYCFDFDITILISLLTIICKQTYFWTINIYLKKYPLKYENHIESSTNVRKSVRAY